MRVALLPYHVLLLAILLLYYLFFCYQINVSDKQLSQRFVMKNKDNFERVVPVQRGKVFSSYVVVGDRSWGKGGGAFGLWLGFRENWHLDLDIFVY